MGRQKGRKKQKADKPAQPGKAAFSNKPFAGLKKTVAERSSQEISESQLSTKPPLDPTEIADVEDDGSAFESAMAGVAPLADRERRVVQEAKPKPLLAEMDDAELVMRHLDDLVHGEIPFDFSDTHEFIEAYVTGLDSRVRRKLRRGDYSYEAHLDLHGYHRDQARAAVGEFIQRCHTQGKRCVLLIHGRGKGSKDNIPVIKNKLAAWLTRGAIGQKVLAYVSARPYDGGTGAVYVLLRGR